MLVGLDYSTGTGYQEIINDPDKDGVFKITDKDNQVLKVITSDGEHEKVQIFDLSGLTLEDE